MLIPDINLLVYAYNAKAPDHERARQWWEAVVNGEREVGVPWVVVVGYVRLMTHPRVLVSPVSTQSAIADVRSWFDQPGVNPIEPGPRHLQILDSLLSAAGAGGSLSTDAHLAALAIELRAELHSNDVDFARFPGLRWVNPLA